MKGADLDSALARVARVRLLVAIDFDGTLAEIVDHPDDAHPVPGAMAALEALAGTGAEVALVSGRRRDDLRARSEAPLGITFVGGHGAEWEDGEDGHPQVPALVRDAERAIDGIAGAWVEAKPFSVTVHSRQVVPDRVADLVRAMEEVATRWGYPLERGKAVVEIHLSTADKGTAVSRLRERAGAEAVVYMGDDTTDEAVFRTLSAGDVGIKVGSGPTAAGFRVPDPVAAVAVVERLADLRARLSGPA